MRLVYLDLGRAYADAYGEQFSRPFAMINPELSNLSPERIRMWDDCLSLPNAMVLVERHRSCDLRFLDASGRAHRWERLPVELAELLQHEVRRLPPARARPPPERAGVALTLARARRRRQCDHLDGVLAVDRVAASGDDGVPGVITREAWLGDRARFDSVVDYSIQ